MLLSTAENFTRRVSLKQRYEPGLPGHHICHLYRDTAALPLLTPGRFVGLGQNPLHAPCTRAGCITISEMLALCGIVAMPLSRATAHPSYGCVSSSRRDLEGPHARPRGAGPSPQPRSLTRERTPEYERPFPMAATAPAVLARGLGRLPRLGPCSGRRLKNRISRKNHLLCRSSKSWLNSHSCRRCTFHTY